VEDFYCLNCSLTDSGGNFCVNYDNCYISCIICPGCGEGDTNCDGMVSGPELLSYMDQWIQEQVGDLSLLEVINNWAFGVCGGGDTNCDGIVSLAEVVDMINLWQNDEVSLSDVIQVINEWTLG